MTVSKTTAVLLLALAAGACKRGDAAETISRERFVAANVAMRVVSEDAPGADSLRAAALRKAGVTAPQLRAWIRANTRRTEVMADVWKEIADSLQRRDSIAIAAGVGRTPPASASVIDTLRPTPLPPGSPPPGIAPRGVVPPAPPGSRPIHIDPRRPMSRKAPPSGQRPDSAYIIPPSP